MRQSDKTLYLLITMSEDNATNVPCIVLWMSNTLCGLYNRAKTIGAMQVGKIQIMGIFKIKYPGNILLMNFDTFLNTEFFKRINTFIKSMVENIHETILSSGIKISKRGEDYFKKYFTGERKYMVQLYNFIKDFPLIVRPTVINAKYSLIL